MHRILAFLIDLARLAFAVTASWAAWQFGLLCRGLVDKFGLHL